MDYKIVLEEALKNLDSPLIKNNPAHSHAIGHLEEMLDDIKKGGDRGDSKMTFGSMKESVKKKSFLGEMFSKEEK